MTQCKGTVCRPLPGLLSCPEILSTAHDGTAQHRRRSLNFGKTSGSVPLRCVQPCATKVCVVFRILLRLGSRVEAGLDRMMWYSMVWHGLTCYGMVWYGMVRHGMVWDGIGWHGMAWYADENLSSFIDRPTTEVHQLLHPFEPMCCAYSSVAARALAPISPSLGFTRAFICAGSGRNMRVKNKKRAQPFVCLV